MDTSKKQMTAAQLRYKLYFDERVRIPKENFKTVSQVFIRKEYNPTDDPKQKLAQISTGPYLVTEVDDKICVILLYNNIDERVTLDIVVLAPQGAT